MYAILKIGGVVLLLQVLNAFEACMATYNRITTKIPFQQYLKEFLKQTYDVDLDESVLGIFLEEFIDANVDKINMIRNVIYMNIGMALVNPLEDFIMDKFRNGRKNISSFIGSMKLPSWANKGKVGMSKVFDLVKGDAVQQVKRASEYAYQSSMVGSNIAQSFNTGHLSSIEKTIRKQGLTPNSNVGIAEILREIQNLQKEVN